MTRLLLALGLIALAAPSAHAQRRGAPPPADAPYADDGYYNGLDLRDDRPAPIRFGIGVGPYVYTGPDILAGDLADQDDIVATNLGVTAELMFPLGSSQLYGRILGGLLNIGADDNRPDVTSPAGIVDPSYNPFLTSETILAEGNLLYYLTPPAASTVSPYVFTGLGALFATGDAAPGISRTALQLPLGAGIEVRLTDALSLYGEAAYRIGLNGVGSQSFTAGANLGDDPVWCSEFPNDPDCKPKDCDLYPDAPGCHAPPTCQQDPTQPGCQVSCQDDPTQPGCPGVGNGGNSSFRTRFNSALFTGGLRFSFGGPRVPAYVPPPYVPPPVVPVVPPPVEPVPVRPVCDLVELNAVYFDFGSSTMSPRTRALLDENVELLLANPECCVFIDGFTDNAEYDRFGMPLAGRRAQAVYDYYLSRGVTASRLQIRNRGVGAPNCDKEDPGLGCERNRRVESLPVDCERFQYLIENPSY